MCVTNTTGRRPRALVIAAKLAAQASANPQTKISSNRSLIADNKNSTSSSATAAALPSGVPQEQQQAQPDNLCFSNCQWFHNGIQTTTEEGRNVVKAKKRRRRPQKPGLTAKNQERHFVHHNYHDHALDHDVSISAAQQEQEKEQQPSRRRRGGVAVSFPMKLHQMLDQIEADGLAYVISWQPHGEFYIS